MSELLTKAQVARAFRVSPPAVSRAIARGDLVPTPKNGRELIDVKLRANLRWLAKPSRPRHRGPGTAKAAPVAGSPAAKLLRAGGRYNLLIDRLNRLSRDHLPRTVAETACGAIIDSLEHELRKIPKAFHGDMAALPELVSTAIQNARAAAAETMRVHIMNAPRAEVRELPPEAPVDADLARVRELLDLAAAARFVLTREIERGRLVPLVALGAHFADLANMTKLLFLQALPGAARAEIPAIKGSPGAWLKAAIEKSLEHLQRFRRFRYENQQTGSGPHAGGCTRRPGSDPGAPRRRSPRRAS